MFNDSSSGVVFCSSNFFFESLKIILSLIFAFSLKHFTILSHLDIIFLIIRKISSGAGVKIVTEIGTTCVRSAIGCSSAVSKNIAIPVFFNPISTEIAIASSLDWQNIFPTIPPKRYPRQGNPSPATIILKT